MSRQPIGVGQELVLFMAKGHIYDGSIEFGGLGRDASSYHKNKIRYLYGVPRRRYARGIGGA